MRSHRLYTVLAAGILALLSILTLQRTQPLERTAQGDVRRISIVNKTRSLEITRAEVIRNQIHITVRNGYKKNINWFRIALGKTSSIEADFAFTESGALSPGETYQDAYPIDPNPDPTITLNAVVFEDKTDEGDEKFLAFIREKREGQKLGLRRLLPLLEKAMSSTSADTDSVLETLEAELSTGQTADTTLSEAKQIGLRNITERMRKEVQGLKFERGNDNGLDIKENLRSLKNHYGRIEGKLTPSRTFVESTLP